MDQFQTYTRSPLEARLTWRLVGIAAAIVAAVKLIPGLDHCARLHPTPERSEKRRVRTSAEGYYPI